MINREGHSIEELEVNVPLTYGADLEVLRELYLLVTDLGRAQSPDDGQTTCV